MKVVVSFLLACSFFSPILASIGDRAPAYQRCINSCTSSCPTPSPRKLLSLYSCSSECSYQCIQRLTNLALASPPLPQASAHSDPDTIIVDAEGELEGLPRAEMVQFHGKWPFVRMLGMQEPLSVLFSILNGVAHYVGFNGLGKVRTRSKEGRRLKVYYRLNAIVGINIWIWSTIFHTRDVDWTERMDYYSAGAGTVFGIWLVGVRLFALRTGGGAQGGSLGENLAISSRRRGWGVLCCLALLAHIAYLNKGERFDYGWNMKINIIGGVLQILAWSICPSPPNSHRPSPLPPLLLLASFTSLELLDFQPVPHSLRLLDAHALWHASTIGVVLGWYKFLIGDLQDLEQVFLGGSLEKTGQM